MGSVGWLAPIFLTATATSGCTAWVLCAFLFLWSNIAEVKRISRRKPARRLFARSSVPGCFAEITWGLA